MRGVRGLLAFLILPTPVTDRGTPNLINGTSNAVVLTRIDNVSVAAVAAPSTWMVGARRCREEHTVAPFL